MSKPDTEVMLNSTTTVTKAELAAILAPGPKWPHPASNDGWVFVHDAIRLDMMDMGEALNRMMTGLKQGTPLAMWQTSNLQRYFAVVYDFLHHHHNIEEEILFPFIKTRVEIDEHFTSDHVLLFDLLSKCRSAINGLQATGNAAADLKTLELLQSAFDEMAALMVAHLKSEEETGLPLLRMHFSAKEMVPVEKRITAGATPADVAHFLRPMADKSAKQKFMSQLGVPWLVQMLIIFPACKRYESKVQRLCEELKQGKQTQASAGGICSWFSG